MSVYRFEGDINEDHQLSIPPEVPLGRARIVVIPQAAAEKGWENMKALIGELAEGPHHTRSKEDIDHYIRSERDSWE